MEINSIPPLPLWTLLAADKETRGVSTGVGANKQKGSEDYDDLFANAADIGGEDNLDSLLDVDDFDVERTSSRKKKRQQSEKQGLSYFGPRQARILSNLLTHAHLPGLTSLDQMYLLALADTVASCQLDLADRFAIDAAKKQIAKETATATNEGEASPGKKYNS